MLSMRGMIAKHFYIAFHQHQLRDMAIRLYNQYSQQTLIASTKADDVL